MTSRFSIAPDARHEPESPYAWFRLAMSLAVGGMVGAGMWTVIVVLPSVQSEFGATRSGASLPFAMTMLGFSLGTIGLGRLSDRTGVVLLIVAAAGLQFLGYVVAGLAPNLTVFALAHIAIGLGSGAGFAPLMADISHWFVKRRGLAVVITASGNYVAGTFWPLVMNFAMPAWGWRMTHIGIGIGILLVTLPLSLTFRPKPLHTTLSAAASAASAARANLGITPGQLQALLIAAGMGCCVAMSMPQVHIVAYCTDLGYGPARGAEMLALMLGLGIISRVGSGFLADRIGGVPTLFIGSLMQGVALALYMFFNGLTSLYIISGIFGLFQGGIVPMYAVIVRDFLPPQEAGRRIGLILGATIVGMALGGYLSGLIFDLTASYRYAFLNGLIWNALNLSVVGWLWHQRSRVRAKLA